MQLDQVEEQLGRRAVAEDDAGGTDAEREQRRGVARVAEEQLRHGKDDVMLVVADGVEGEVVE